MTLDDHLELEKRKKELKELLSKTFTNNIYDLYKVKQYNASIQPKMYQPRTRV